MDDEVIINIPKSAIEIRPRRLNNNRTENKNPTDPNRISVNDKALNFAAEKKKKKKEEIFKDRAISFLKGISTGSPVIAGRSTSVPEPLMLVPSDTNPYPGFTRNQEEDLEIGKVQA